MNKTTPRELFVTGEFVAGKYLAENGFEIIETNYRSPFGEIDIITIKKNTLAFVEVKTRRKHSLELALANINYTNKRK
jgi:putative endonuclease